jgi:hypothetical protein
MTYVLVIGHQTDALPLLDAGYYGPFDAVETAQRYAQDWRRVGALPCGNLLPTPEENEAWTDLGFTFGIFELKLPDQRGTVLRSFTDRIMADAEAERVGGRVVFTGLLYVLVVDEEEAGL